jgi:hypothetical protein
LMNDTTPYKLSSPPLRSGATLPMGVYTLSGAGAPPAPLRTLPPPHPLLAVRGFFAARLP